MINSENRNNIHVIPPIVRTRTPRCCSFCRQPGHNLTTCNSDRLREFEIICSDTVTNIDSPEEFKTWITEHYINDQLLLKAFAIRKFRVTTRTSIVHCIDLITQYIFRTYKNIIIPLNNEEGFENDIINFLTELRNVRENEQSQEIQDVLGIERIVMRDMLLYALFNNMITTIREQYNGERKLDIISTVEINENENINKICECNICYEEKEVKNFVKLNCNHEFCKDCLINSVKSDRRELPCCAFCRTEIKSFTSRTDEVHSELSNLVA